MYKIQFVLHSVCDPLLGLSTKKKPFHFFKYEKCRLWLKFQWLKSFFSFDCFLTNFVHHRLICTQKSMSICIIWSTLDGAILSFVYFLVLGRECADTEGKDGNWMNETGFSFVSAIGHNIFLIFILPWIIISRSREWERFHQFRFQTKNYWLDFFSYFQL